MAKFLPLVTNPIEENGAYFKTRQKEADIVKRQRLLDGELYKAMMSTPFDILAHRMTDHFFPRSRNLVIYQDMVQMNKALLALAPVLQKLPHSMLFDWHQGHVMSHFKTGTNRKAGRYFFARIELSRNLDHTQLIENLHYLQIFDEKFSAALVDLFRNYYGRSSLTGRLASTLFDPLMFCRHTEGNSLRVGDTLYFLSNRPFDGCTDLREETGTVLTYRVKKYEGKEQGYLEIYIDDRHVVDFKRRVKRIMETGLSPEFKISLVERQMNRFMGGARYARSGFMQVVEVSRWLRDKLIPLRPKIEEASYYHKVFVNRFEMGLDIKRYPTKRPNFFHDPRKHDIQTFIRFFSPFREEG